MTTPVISTEKCLSFLAVLALIIFCDLFIENPLYTWSHDLLVRLGPEESSAQATFWKVISKIGKGDAYKIAGISLYPFLSRPRYYYYLFAGFMLFSLIHIMKYIWHTPRPVWYYGDLNSYSCSTGFANPSGHSFSASTFTLFVVLDLYFPSTWWKLNYPDLHSKNPFRKNKFVIVLVSVFLLCVFYPIQIVDRLFLGKHSLDELIFGSSLGFWSALFCHFVLRDWIFAHISEIATSSIVNRESLVTSAKISTLIIVINYIIYFGVCLAGQIYFTVPQVWMENMRDICGKKFETDPDTGLLIPSYGSFFYPGAHEAGQLFFFLSQYIGLILYRLHGYPSLPDDAFTYKKSIFAQLALSVPLTIIGFLWIRHHIVPLTVPYWAQILFIGLVPGLINGFLLSYFVPVGLLKCQFNYPKTGDSTQDVLLEKNVNERLIDDAQVHDEDETNDAEPINN